MKWVLDLKELGFIDKKQKINEIRLKLKGIEKKVIFYDVSG